MQADSLSTEQAGPERAAIRGHALLRIRDLSCSRNDVPVFRNLAFSLSPGQILLVEGGNGSGKTTLLRILCGLLEPETGEILWHGDDVRFDYGRFLQDICYIGHGNGIKPGLTSRENLAFARDISAADRNRDVTTILERFGLQRFRDIPAQRLSAGQRRRLALARLLFEYRTLWLLDEPFTSLDEDGRGLLRRMFSDHLANGGAVVMTSHDPFHWDEPSLQRLRLS